MLLIVLYKMYVYLVMDESTKRPIPRAKRVSALVTVITYTKTNSDGVT